MPYVPPKSSPVMTTFPLPHHPRALSEPGPRQHYAYDSFPGKGNGNGNETGYPSSKTNSEPNSNPCWSSNGDGRQNDEPDNPSRTPSKRAHRRSYSHTHIAAPEATAFTPTSGDAGAGGFASTSTAMSLPRRRRSATYGSSLASSTPSVSSGSPSSSAAAPSSSTVVGSPSSNGHANEHSSVNAQLNGRRAVKLKPTFHLGRDDDSDDSEEEEASASQSGYRTLDMPYPGSSIIFPKWRKELQDEVPGKKTNEDDEEDRLPLLPPLRLKVKTSSFDMAVTLVGNSSQPPPQAHQIPFPRRPDSPPSPKESPNHSPPTNGSHDSSITIKPLAPPFTISQTTTTLDFATANAQPTRPQVSRTSSTPILLNGRPLKSSLKKLKNSSFSSLDGNSSSGRLNTGSDTANGACASSPTHLPHLHQHQYHTRTHSESVPSLSSSSSLSSSPPSPSPPGSPSRMDSHPPQKNVHFPSADDPSGKGPPLATVKVFNRSARPAALSLPNTPGSGSAGSLHHHLRHLHTGTNVEAEASNTEADTTEGTSGEESASSGGGWKAWRKWGRLGAWNSGGSAGVVTSNQLSNSNSSTPKEGVKGKEGFPFPTTQVGPAENFHRKVPDQEWYYALDAPNCSAIPAASMARHEGNIFFESCGFVLEDSSSHSTSTRFPARPLTLTGTVVVRNIAYAKTVAIRFTLDDWHTTSEVLATHEKSLVNLPLPGFETSSFSKVQSPYALLPSVSEGESNSNGEEGALTWDRFRFNISLEDNASSSTLHARTMWVVGRYESGASLSQVDGTGAGAEGGEAKRQEWWDNNGGGNYKLVFARHEVPGVSAVTVGNGLREKRGINLSAPLPYAPHPHYQRQHPPLTLAHPPRRAMPAIHHHQHFPQQFAYDPTATMATKSYPVPRQMSASYSFPGYSAATQAERERERQQAQYQQQHQQHREQLAQSTLACLRKLNLKNYAAPAAAGGVTSPTLSLGKNADNLITANGASSAQPPLPPSNLTSSSTNTSTDSTPVQTPTQDTPMGRIRRPSEEELTVPLSLSDVELGLDMGIVALGGGMRMGMENGYPATLSGKNLDGARWAWGGGVPITPIPRSATIQRRDTDEEDCDTETQQRDLGGPSLSESLRSATPTRAMFTLSPSSGGRGGSGSDSGSGSDGSKGDARTRDVTLNVGRWKNLNLGMRPGSPMPVSFPIVNSPRSSPRASPEISPASSSTTITQSPPLPSPTLSKTDDPLYQAFVRQWCFAQAPGPIVGASVRGGGAMNNTGSSGNEPGTQTDHGVNGRAGVLVG